MQIKKFYIALAVCFLLNATKAFCFEPVSTSELLMSYLENDTNLKNNAIDAQKAQLTLDSTKINNGFDITLSTGNITITAGKDGTSFSVRPTVQASLPATSNLSVSASTNYSYKADTSNLSDTKLNASIDIISSTELSRKISLMKAERSLTEATRKLRNQAINTEKTFYTELKALVNSTQSLINQQKNLYTDKINFEKIRAQGYSTGSSTYRLAQMKVVSDEHDIESSTRSLVHSYIVFYKKCGYDITLPEDVNFYDLIPTDITAIDPIDVHTFNPDLYTEIESKLWTNKINTLQRQTSKNFTLSANGGVTFKNSSTASDTVDAGISSKIGGLSLNAGVNIPLKDEITPTFTLSATLSPKTYRLNNINQQQQQLEEEQELIAIENARTSYSTKVKECEQNLSDLLWTKKTNEESYEMYTSLAKELNNWYKQGIITESEYYSAQVNAQSYNVKKIINAIDFIIYNDNIVTMFVEDPQEN